MSARLPNARRREASRFSLRRRQKRRSRGGLCNARNHRGHNQTSPCRLTISSTLPLGKGLPRAQSPHPPMISLGPQHHQVTRAAWDWEEAEAGAETDSGSVSESPKSYTSGEDQGTKTFTYQSDALHILPFCFSVWKVEG